MLVAQRPETNCPCGQGYNPALIGYNESCQYLLVMLRLLVTFQFNQQSGALLLVTPPPLFAKLGIV